MKPPTDQALPSRPSPAAAGARLGELYSAHARMVYGICRMLLHHADEAEDATQQVFLAAYRSLLTGTEVRDPAAWLGTIARNTCRRRATALTREPLPFAGGPVIASPAADDAAIGREETNALYAELATLPVRQREAVVLRDLYGLRYAEVAKALGTSRPAVEGLLIRGRRQLRRRLRPGVAAGVLAVPLAIQESIAYAVPGFASAAAPTGVAAAAAGIPLAAKLATAGTAAALAGSAGVVAEQRLHDPPSRPAPPPAAAVSEPTESSATTTTGAAVAVSPQPLPRLLPVPPGGFPVAKQRDNDDNSGPGGGHDDEPRTVAVVDDADEDRAPDDNSGPGSGADETEQEDNSGPGSGSHSGNADHSGSEPEDAGEHGGGDSSGPGGGEDNDG